MKLLCLNCREVGLPEAVQEICNLCKLHHLMVVFLLKTRLFDDKVDLLQQSLSFSNGVGVGSFGRGGGMALLWNGKYS
jgi:hypothetical protein